MLTDQAWVAPSAPIYTGSAAGVPVFTQGNIQTNFTAVLPGQTVLNNLPLCLRRCSAWVISFPSRATAALGFCATLIVPAPPRCLSPLLVSARFYYVFPPFYKSCLSQCSPFCFYTPDPSPGLSLVLVFRLSATLRILIVRVQFVAGPCLTSFTPCISCLAAAF